MVKPQAQLCALWEPHKIQALRKNGIRDIFGYWDAMGCAASLGSVQGIVGAPKEILERHKSVLEADPAFRELRELSQALSAYTVPETKERAKSLGDGEQRANGASTDCIIIAEIVHS